MRLAPDAKSRWERLAREYFHKDASALARSVLEEFMSCFISDQELLEMGMAALAGRRPGGLLLLAVKRAERPGEESLASARISEETQDILFTALRSILEFAPETIVEDMVSRLTLLAGRYGEERIQPAQKSGKSGAKK